ncbi:hypothetical protein PR202_ga08691 [Eleusine coracana subsp. coracana]|uniref:Uncharacterized protein n=1 Tax=Eleusine coracana subsp. coracana TaxID=191504 RepID=A0AAV5C1X1_ELECO|nr:hypothetical protein PR202_ga08691 [Eleusine coracana subsp. coracana]
MEDQPPASSSMEITAALGWSSRARNQVRAGPSAGFPIGRGNRIPLRRQIHGNRRWWWVVCVRSCEAELDGLFDEGGGRAGSG